MKPFLKHINKALRTASKIAVVEVPNGRFKKKNVQSSCFHGIVDGRGPANWLRLVVHPIVDRVSYIPGGAGFLPFAVQKRNQSTTHIDPLPNMQS